MEKIKVRGWDKNNNKMILPPSEFSSNLGGHFLTLDGRCYIEGKYQDVLWMLYCGEDKNEKEMYEHDIVRFHIFYFDGCGEAEREMVGTIGWGEYGLWFNGENPDDSGYVVNYHGLHEDSFEVIGNIYETPDLITQNKLSIDD